jgi:diaminopimelate epimerase
MKISFTKMSGAGNDFVVIDNRIGVIRRRSAAARKLCDRRWGIGADGLLLLEKSQKAAYQMMYFNADGSYGGMCGNGGRCIARFAVDRGLAKPDHTFEALNYLYRVKVEPNKKVTLWMKDPKDLQLDIVLRLSGRTMKVHYVDTGSPHVVIPLEELRRRGLKLEDIDMDSIGHEVRYHKRFFPQGTNVNVIELRHHKTIGIRTYERGVEAETLACGTGSVAAALIAHQVYRIKSPVRVEPRSGVRLLVAFEAKEGKYTEVQLMGPAVSTFDGEINFVG